MQTIQKQMAIVAWQPGPNRIVQLPDLVRVSVHLQWSLPRTSWCSQQAMQSVSTGPARKLGDRHERAAISAVVEDCGMVDACGCAAGAVLRREGVLRRCCRRRCSR